MQKLMLSLISAVPLMVAAQPAQAYIGPGAGAGTIAVVLGILATVVMAFLGLLWYPAKRLLKGRGGKTPVASAGAESAAAESYNKK